MNIVYNLINIGRWLIKDSVFDHFDVSRDLVIIDYPLDLVKVYRENPIRLVIVEAHSNFLYKEGLVALKKYDPYARLLLVEKEVKTEDKLFYREVVKKYVEDLWM